MNPDTAEGDALRTFNHHASSVDGLQTLYRAMHAGCPVGRSEELGGFYILSRHADIRAAAANWQDFSSAQGFTLPVQPFRILGVEMDPPEHTRWRKLWNEVLNLQAVRDFTPRVRAHADALVDAVLDRGEADAVTCFAEPLPMFAILDLIGIDDPERAEIGVGLAGNAFALIGEPELFMQAMGAYAAFCIEEAEARRAAPRDDFLTRIATRPVGDEPLTDPEIANILMGFLLAGVHSTSSGIASLLRHAASHPEMRDRLWGDADLVNAAIEETLRLDTPLHTFFRTTTREVEVGETVIPSGSKVMLAYGAANRDPEAFECPHEFRVDRGANRHLAFGHGVHSCVGSQFARLQMRTMLQVVIERLPNFRLADARCPPPVLVGGQLVTHTQVPVAWGVRG